jgi:hypothetical protein
MHLTAYASGDIFSFVLQLLTTDEFARWFEALGDKQAEDVATALDVVEQLGPTRAPPGSREALLWYEHPYAARFRAGGSLAWDLEDWGCFRDYAVQIIAKLESPRFAARLARLPSREANEVLALLRQLKRAMSDPRLMWTFRSNARGDLAGRPRAEDACAEVRRLYLAALEAAGFKATDVPAHSLALRELARRLPGPPFRLLYGVNAEKETALFVLGEQLDRTFYGDSVRRAEALWKQYLDGTLHHVEPAQLR